MFCENQASYKQKICYYQYMWFWLGLYFSLAPAAFATAIFKLSILFSILFGWLILKEGRIRDRLLGAIVMIFGTALLVL